LYSAPLTVILSYSESIFMKILSLFGLSLISCISLSAQVKDTTGVPKKSFEASLFANDDTLTRSDYLLSLEKVFQLLNKASTLAQPVPAILSMSAEMDEDDSVLNIIKDRLSSNDRALNVRNLQMFNILLKQIKTDTRDHAKQLNQYFVNLTRCPHPKRPVSL